MICATAVLMICDAVLLLCWCATDLLGQYFIWLIAHPCVYFFLPVLREKPSQQQPSFGEDKGSLLESAEGAAYWGGDGGGREEAAQLSLRVH